MFRSRPVCAPSCLPVGSRTGSTEVGRDPLLWPLCGRQTMRQLLIFVSHTTASLGGDSWELNLLDLRLLILLRLFL